MANFVPKSGENITKVAVLGAGTWGGTLSRILSLAGKEVSLWSRDEGKATQLRQSRKLEKPLSIDLPPAIEISSDLEKCIADKQIILFCCTSQSLRSVATQVKAILKCSVSAGNTAKSSTLPRSHFPIVVNAAKGLELDSFRRMSEILEEILEELPACSLSGPNLAAEILNGLPTASVIACKDPDVARYVQQELSVPTLRLYWNVDVKGVELGGALKNVIAIAAGGVDGLALGHNAKAALLTRGLAEITRLAVHLGAQANTLAGLAGLGDLLATCSSPLSRNYKLGYSIARGASLSNAEADLGAVAEGINTSYAVCQMARQLNVEMPIADQVESALKGNISPQKAIMNLMTRPLVSE